MFILLGLPGMTLEDVQSVGVFLLLQIWKTVNLKEKELFSWLSVYIGKEPWPEVVLSLEIKKNAFLCYRFSDALQL